jgi:hypothetical protein
MVETDSVVEGGIGALGIEEVIPFPSINEGSEESNPPVSIPKSEVSAIFLQKRSSSIMTDFLYPPN